VLYYRSCTMLLKEGHGLISRSQRRDSSVCQSPRIVTSCQKYRMCMLACSKSSMSDLVAMPVVMALPAFPATKEKLSHSVQCPLSYLSTTSIGITDKQKRLRHNIFPLVSSGTFLQYGIVGPILTLFICLLRHACQVTVLLFFVPISGLVSTQSRELEIST
jgi:hypothetical protein